MSKKKYRSRRQEQAAKQRVRNMVVIGVVVLALVGTLIWQQTRPELVSLERQMEQPVRGNPEALVSLEIFSDFGCPACQSLANSQVLEEVLNTYGDQVNIVWRDFPVIAPPKSVGAAEAGQCAHDQGLFWLFHDITYARQNFEEFGAAHLRAYAALAGLDLAAYDACIDAGIHAATVNYDLKEARQLGLRGTPALVINDVHLYGAFGNPTILNNAIEAAILATEQ